MSSDYCFVTFVFSEHFVPSTNSPTGLHSDVMIPKQLYFVNGFPLTLKFCDRRWWKESPNVNASENSSFLENTSLFVCFSKGFCAVMSNSGNSKSHILQKGKEKTGFDESHNIQPVFDLRDQTTYAGNTFVLFYLNLDPPNSLH